MNILRQHKQQQNMSLDKSLNLFKILYNAACEGNQSGLHWLAFHLLFQWWGNMCSAYCCLAVKMLVILTLFLPLFSAKALGMAISLGMHHGSVYIFDILCLWLRTRAMKKMFLYDTALVMDEFKLLVTRTCLRSLLHWFVIRAKAWQKAGTLTPPVDIPWISLKIVLAMKGGRWHRFGLIYPECGWHPGLISRNKLLPPFSNQLQTPLK